MRLIDADALREIVEDGLRNNPHTDGYARSCHRVEYAHFLDVICRMPTIAPPPNDPLTLEELREMAQRCEGIYVAHTDGSPVFRDQTYCAAVLDFQPAFGSLSMHIQAIYGERLTLWEDEYGDTWLAYRRKPEEGTGVGS